MTPPIGGGNFTSDEAFFRQSIKNLHKRRLIERDHVAECHLIDVRLAFNDVQRSVLHSRQPKVGGFFKKYCNRYLIEPPNQMPCAGIKTIQNSFRLSDGANDPNTSPVTITALTPATIIATSTVAAGEIEQDAHRSAVCVA